MLTHHLENKRQNYSTPQQKSAKQLKAQSPDFVDKRPVAALQAKFQAWANEGNTPKEQFITQLKSYAKAAAQRKGMAKGEKPIQRMEEEELLQGKFKPIQRMEEEELLQGKFKPIQRMEEEELLQGKFRTTPIQRKEKEGRYSLANLGKKATSIQRKSNNTGLPDNLKSGIENLSGLAMDDVKVHYNSAKPAQLQAHAYAQGTEIHLEAGQEKHLPHEAWHVVQQKQGRVRPTMQMKGGVQVNDDAGLEKEADVMGARALQNGSPKQLKRNNWNNFGKNRVLQKMKLSTPLGYIFSSFAFDNKHIRDSVSVEQAKTARDARTDLSSKIPNTIVEKQAFIDTVGNCLITSPTFELSIPSKKAYSAKLLKRKTTKKGHDEWDVIETNKVKVSGFWGKDRWGNDKFIINHMFPTVHTAAQIYDAQFPEL